MIDLTQLKNIIHYTPARQNQVFYYVDLKRIDLGVEVIIKPTLDFYDKNKTSESNPNLLYKSSLFHTGMLVGSLEYWANWNNLGITVESTVQEHQKANSQVGVWLMGLRKQVIGHLVDWVEEQKVFNNLFKNYQYDISKCHRDLNFLFNAFYQDFENSTESTIVNNAKMFWDKNGVAVSRRPQEVAIHTELRRYLEEKSGSLTVTQRQQFLSLYDKFITILAQGPNAVTDYVEKTYNDTIKVTIYEQMGNIKPHTSGV